MEESYAFQFFPGRETLHAFVRQMRAIDRELFKVLKAAEVRECFIVEGAFVIEGAFAERLQRADLFPLFGRDGAGVFEEDFARDAGFVFFDLSAHCFKRSDRFGVAREK